jgi:hypothetical protein
MTEPEKLPKRILGRRFLDALGEAGIIKKGDYVRRVIIDANMTDALTMYVERYGDERMLAVALGLSGFEIQEAKTRYYDGDAS